MWRVFVEETAVFVRCRAACARASSSTAPRPWSVGCAPPSLIVILTIAFDVYTCSLFEFMLKEPMRLSLSLSVSLSLYLGMLTRLYALYYVTSSHTRTHHIYFIMTRVYASSARQPATFTYTQRHDCMHAPSTHTHMFNRGECMQVCMKT